MTKSDLQFKAVSLESADGPLTNDNKPKRSRWLAFGLGFAAILLFGGGGGYWWLTNQTTGTPQFPDSSGSDDVPTVTPVPLRAWDDPAGFTFEYPENLIVNKHDEDQENYAHVEMSNDDYPGKIVIWVKDLPMTSKKMVIIDVSEWVISDSILSAGNSVDTTLGDKTAKKILLKSPPEKLVTGVVFDDVLWIVEGEFIDKAYWSDVYKTITDSFKFKPTVNQTSGSVDSSADVAVDEEEVVE